MTALALAVLLRVVGTDGAHLTDIPDASAVCVGPSGWTLVLRRAVVFSDGFEDGAARWQGWSPCL